MSTIQVYMVSIGVRVWSTLQYTLLEVVADVLKLQQNNFKSIIIQIWVIIRVLKCTVDDKYEMMLEQVTMTCL